MIPQQIIDQIQDRADIVEIIGSHVQLRRAGQNFKGCCPFHQEKTPSFVVSPDKQIFHCFGCSVGGNVFSFLMKMEGIDFREAAKQLADRTGIEIPEDESVRSAREQLEPLYGASAKAADLYHQYLKKSAEDSPVWKYLHKRGIAQHLIDRFRIGYSPNEWDAFIQKVASDYKTETLVSAGLALKKQGGGYYDRFRNRLMFPISDLKGRTVGFGARVLDDSLPKYVNTPDTPIYHKSRVLYGIHEGVKAIREAGKVLIVEGYMDVIGCHAAGVENVVASSGTALTTDQIRLIKRYTTQVTMLFDADQAGQLATLRGTDLLISEGCSVNVASMPKGHDPDSYVKTFGAEDFKNKVIEQAKPIFEYKFALLKTEYDPNNPEGKAQISEGMISTIRRVPNEVLKASLISDLADKLSVPEQALMQELKKSGSVRQVVTKKPEVKTVSRPNQKVSPAEKLLLGLTTSFEGAWQKAKDTEIKRYFINETARNLYDRILAHDTWESARPSRLMSELIEDDVASVLLRECVREVEGVTDAGKAFDDCLNHFNQREQVGRQETLRRQIIESERRGDFETLKRLQQEYNDILHRSKKANG